MTFENERSAVLLADQIHQELRKARERIKELEAQCYRWEEKCGDLSGELRKAEESEAELQIALQELQRLPELPWAEVCASLMQRFARLARNGDPEEAQLLVTVLDKGKTYVNRLLTRIAELEKTR